MATTSVTKKILVVEDHPLFRAMLVQLISREPGMTVCGDVDNPKDALTVFERTLPDAVMIDLSLHGSSGLKLIPVLKARKLEIPVLVISMHTERHYAERALRAGAKGYVSKQESPTEIIAAIRKILAGKTYVNCGVDEAILKRFEQNNQPVLFSLINLLSERELEVFQLIGLGLNSQEIAGQIKFAPAAVESHQVKIMEKLGIKNIVEVYQCAAHWLAKNGQ